MNTQPYKVCPSCGQPSVLSRLACGRCGRQFQSATPPWYRSTWSDVTNRPNEALIAIMWMLTVAAVGSSLSFGLPLAMVIDLVSVVCAIVLVSTPNQTNRIHGRIKLGLECGFFMVGFLSGLLSTLPH